jgi:tetratricopeptide (TPR) repeat protein
MEAGKTQEAKSEDTIYTFIEKYRIFFIVLLAVIAAGLLGSVAFFTIRNNMQKKAIAKLEVLEKQKNDLGEITEAEASKVDALLADLNAFAPAAFGYAAAKAYALTADIYFARKEWGLAEEAWLNSALKGAKTYLAPISLSNAAAAAEEQGRLDEALDYYKQTADFAGVFAAVDRSRFNIGRIYEAKNDKEAAKEAYRALIKESGGDSSWAKLAQSRIIALELE